MDRTNLRPVFIKITAYHLIVLVVLVMAITERPGVGELLPVGTGDKALSAPQGGALTGTEYLDRLDGSSWTEKLLFLILSFACSIAVSVPVAWTYLATRSPKKRDTTFAQAIVLMPIAVTGLVLVVQNSLALAFALAGIVAGAGIRFRTNIREVVDTLFFLIAICIGVASGVGSLGIALVTSIVFTYALLITTTLDFGGLNRASTKESKKPEDRDEPEPVE